MARSQQPAEEIVFDDLHGVADDDNTVVEVDLDAKDDAQITRRARTSSGDGSPTGDDDTFEPLNKRVADGHADDDDDEFEDYQPATDGGPADPSWERYLADLEEHEDDVLKMGEAALPMLLHAMNHRTRKFAAAGLQIAAGVPLQCDEPDDFSTFRLGLFGLDKLHNVDRTLATLEKALDAFA